MHSKIIPKRVLQHAGIPRDIKESKMPTLKFGRFWPKTVGLLSLEKSRFLDKKQIFF